MATKVATVNQILLNRGADLSYNDENVYVPFGNFAAKDLPGTLDALGGDRILVEYKTVSDPEARERDRAKFTKRLDGLGPGWARTEWANRVTGGFVFPDNMQCVLTRIEG